MHTATDRHADDRAVVDMRWPADEERRREMARDGRPRLLIVDHGIEPPATLDPLEDWVRPDADAVERHVRRERLGRRAAARAPASIDDDGLLHRGPRWVALPPGERAALATLLSAPGCMVARADLAAAIGHSDDAGDRRAIDSVVRRVRTRIAPLGMAVCVVRGAGFLLEMGELPL